MELRIKTEGRFDGKAKALVVAYFGTKASGFYDDTFVFFAHNYEYDGVKPTLEAGKAAVFRHGKFVASAGASVDAHGVTITFPSDIARGKRLIFAATGYGHAVFYAHLDKQSTAPKNIFQNW